MYLRRVMRGGKIDISKVLIPIRRKTQKMNFFFNFFLTL